MRWQLHRFVSRIPAPFKVVSGTLLEAVGGPLGVPCGTLGCNLVSFGTLFGSLGLIVESCVGPLGALGRSCGLLGASGALAGKIWEISGGILEASWKYFW